MDNNDIIELLDELYGMVTEAWGVPLGNDKCIIEREKAINIINNIKEALPASIAESKRLVAARDEFIGNAKREAEALRKSAEEKARAMVEEQEIVRVARVRSAEMIASAESKSRELRRVPTPLSRAAPVPPPRRRAPQARAACSRAAWCRSSMTNKDPH